MGDFGEKTYDGRAFDCQRSARGGREPMREEALRPRADDLIQLI